VNVIILNRRGARILGPGRIEIYDDMHDAIDVDEPVQVWTRKGEKIPKDARIKKISPFVPKTGIGEIIKVLLEAK